MQIIVDSREKAPYTFESERYNDMYIVSGKLDVGDYSVKGAENLVACERKSISDLIQSISRERDRFERELQRSLSLESFCVVVEGTWAQIASGQYRHKMLPSLASQTLLSFTAKYRCNFLFAGSRMQGEYMTANFLRYYAQDKKDFLEKLQRAIGDEKP